jgi:hypothetical protein
MNASSETEMFILVGVIVVYGFALFGLATYLEKVHKRQAMGT